MEQVKVYVDGSFDNRSICGAGIVMYYDGENNPPTIHKYHSKEKNYTDSRNVVGEIIASSMAIAHAYKKVVKNLKIFYDYEGIKKWADGEWKAKKPLTQQYRDFVASMRDKMHIEFSHTTAHTGIKGNELADYYAKEAIDDVE